MARKKMNQDDQEPDINQDLDLRDVVDGEEPTEDGDYNDEETEDAGIDEILGGATLGRAAGDLDGWGGADDFES